MEVKKNLETKPWRLKLEKKKFVMSFMITMTITLRRERKNFMITYLKRFNCMKKLINRLHQHNKQ
jgi:hypothetical protein